MIVLVCDYCTYKIEDIEKIEAYKLVSLDGGPIDPNAELVGEETFFCLTCNVIYRVGEELLTSMNLERNVEEVRYVVPSNEAKHPVEWPDGVWRNEHYWWLYQQPRPPFIRELGVGNRRVELSFPPPISAANYNHLLRDQLIDAAKKLRPEPIFRDMSQVTQIAMNEFPQLRSFYSSPGSTPRIKPSNERKQIMRISPPKHWR